jgi:hypothetical protein
MDRARLAEHLAQAERHVVLGEAHLQRQRVIVTELERAGADTGEARRLLANLEEMQTLHVADRDRLRDELGTTE